jgi:replication factor A1
MPDPVEEIIRAVGSNDEKIRDSIKREFNSLIELGVNPEQAKETMIKKYAKSIEKKIADLSGDEHQVNLTVRVVSLREREVTARGERKKVYFGFLEDETGQCSYSTWQEPKFKAGDTIRISNAYITTWNETKRVNIRGINDAVLSEKTIEIKRESKAIKIVDTETYKGRAKLVCKVLSLREFENSGIKVFRGTVGDDTGCALISFWKDFHVKEDDTIEINGVTVSQPYALSVSENAEVQKSPASIKVNPLKVSRVQLNFRNVSVIGKVYGLTKNEVTRGVITDGKKTLPFISWKSSEFNDGDVILAKNCNVKRYLSAIRIDMNGDVEKIRDPVLENVSIEEEVKTIAEAEGMVTIEGFMIDLKREGSGLLHRCPQCNRVLTEMRCPSHGTVTEPKIDLRIKGVIDDGSDSATLVLNRTLSEKLLGKTLNEYVEIAQRALNPAVVLEDCEKIILRPYIVRGVFIRDDLGKTIIATAIDPVDRDLSAEAEKILEGYL